MTQVAVSAVATDDLKSGRAATGGGCSQSTATMSWGELKSSMQQGVRVDVRVVRASVPTRMRSFAAAGGARHHASKWHASLVHLA